MPNNNGPLACSVALLPEPTPVLGQYFDDSAISAKIKAKLLNDLVVGGLSINVETNKGKVQLSGFAKSNSEIKQAERLVRETEGVQAVRNDILLKD